MAFGDGREGNILIFGRCILKYSGIKYYNTCSLQWNSWAKMYVCACVYDLYTNKTNTAKCWKLLNLGDKIIVVYYIGLIIILYV